MLSKIKHICEIIWKKIKAICSSIANSQRKQNVCIIVGTLIISMYIASVIIQIPKAYNGDIGKVYLFPVMTILFWFAYIKETILITLVLYAMLLYGAFYLKRLLTKDYVYDKERNVKVAKDGMYGNAHFATDEEKEETFYMSKIANEIWEDILGRDKYGVFYARKPVTFTNKNVIIIGPPGSGKSACILNNDILQTIKRGDSAIVVDSKGGIYEDTAYAAKKKDYNVKIFNTRPTEVENSDGCDFFKIIKNGNKRKAKGLANSLATTIVMNLNDENAKKDIWYKGALNLLRAMILATCFDEEIPLSERTLGKMYMTMVENPSVPALEAVYHYIGKDRTHPAYESWKTFTGSRDVVKESVLGGLLTDLNFLADDYVREMVSNDEIDFTAPGFEKSIYYIIIDDQDKSNNVLASLFLECCTLQLKNAADSQPSKSLPIQVSIKIDEFKNVGKLPSMGEKLSTYRSRNMPIMIIIQDISQLEQMYPREAWREFMADVTTRIILAVGEQQTAEYFEKEMGTQTALVDNIRDSRSKKEIVHLVNNYQSTQGKGQRPLMFASEIMGQGKDGLKDTEMLVIVKGRAPIKLNKFFWYEHPLCKAYHLDDERRKTRTYEHIPAWRATYERKEERQRERAANINKQVVNIPANGMVAINLNNQLGHKSGGKYEKSNTL